MFELRHNEKELFLYVQEKRYFYYTIHFRHVVCLFYMG